MVEIYLEGNGFSAAAGVGGLAILVMRAEGALTTGPQQGHGGEPGPCESLGD